MKKTDIEFFYRFLETSKGNRSAWKLKILIDSSHTLKKLKEDVPGWWRQFENGTDDQKNRIKDHIFLYLKMWDPTSGYSIRVNPQNLGSTILNDPTEGGVNIHDYSGMYKIFKRWSRWQRGNSFCYSTIVSSIAEMLYQW